jgi:phosphatidylserine decarboxylase
MCMRQREIPAIRRAAPAVLEAVLQAVPHRRHRRALPHRANIYARLPRVHSLLRDRQLLLHAHGKKPVEDELTVDEAIRCLEMQVERPPNEKKRVIPAEEGGSLLDLSSPGTPGGSGMRMSRSLSTQAPPQLGKLDFSGPHMHLLQDLEVSLDDGALKVSLPPPPPPQSAYLTEFSQQPLAEPAAGVGGGVQKTHPSSYPARQSSGASSDAEDSSGSGSGSGSSSEDTFERLISVNNCPLCHRPWLNKKAEVDIITHVTVCASGDWAKTDKIVVGNFVTASQAQRKWYTKVISKVSSGDYRLGAVRFSFPFFECAV